MQVNDRLNNNHIFAPGHPCTLCSDEIFGASPVCEGCQGDFFRLEQACKICCDRVICEKAHTDQLICGRCQQSPPSFDETLACFTYLPPLDRLVWEFKFRARFDLGDWFARVLADRVREASQPEVLLAVPMHARGVHTRGYNQAAYLADHVGKDLGLPVARNVIHRVHASPAQHQLDYQNRLKNLKDVFAVQHLEDWSHIALLDDVMTTGATVEAVARLLKEAGVNRVSVWVVARTWLDN